MATFNRQIKIRRDTAANFTSNNPTLASGELALETDTGKMKRGDASTAWTNALYFNRWNFVTGTAANYSFSTNGEPTHLTFTRDGTARTITLEDDAAHDGQILGITVTGGGAGNITLNTSAATVDGETDSTWEWDGEGTLYLIYDHADTNYILASTGIWDIYSTGTTAGNGDVKKYTNGLRYYDGWDFIQGTASDLVQVSRNLPITLSSPTKVEGTCYGFKASSDPTTQYDLSGAAVQQIGICQYSSTTQIILALADVTGAATGTTNRFLINVGTIDNWR